MSNEIISEPENSAVEAEIIPVLPLRDVVVFPHMVIPLFVGRTKSIKALEVAMAKGKQIFLLAQKEANVEDPKIEDLYDIGTISTVLQLLKLPDGTVKVLVEGTQRGRVIKIIEEEGYYLVEYEILHDSIPDTKEREALSRVLLAQFEEYIKLNKKIPPEILTSLAGIDDLGRLIDTIAAHMSIKVEEKQKILQELDVKKRMEVTLAQLDIEIDMCKVEGRIQKTVRKEMEKSQRGYYLNEKMKAIQKELGELGEGPVGDLNAIEEKIKKVGLSEEAKEKAKSELAKLKTMPPMSAEATVIRTYLDELLKVPWKARTKVNKDLAKAEAILEEDHYGLEKVKERIIEFLAVQQRVEQLKGPILCLVGPPGVGKTSLGKSIARATGREFIRMSLGGVRDEAEIRGHRRTYIGSMPGRIIQKMSKVKVRNPLFMLDEIDKMAMDFRGDPASALLEVLDPEQNSTFNDHYLEVDYDLSEVMFVTTANSLNIPPPLLDRMEVIRLPGYTENEKLNIATKYLIPKQKEQSGLNEEELEISNDAIIDIIRYYTREAGVRNLEREIAQICRKVVKEILMNKNLKRVKITRNDLEKYLGVIRYRYGLAEEKPEIGRVTGMAWTEVGGELLTIECAVVPGRGKFVYTGHLGDVMQESIQAAMTVVRSRAERLGIPDNVAQKYDVHIHLPEGATPKDGPSAGIGICTALVSALTKIPVRPDIAMTGEITLRGEVLIVGGLKEKLLAALRGGIKTVIIPQENKKDLKELPKEVTEGLEIKPVKWIDEVFELVLAESPKPLSKKKAKAKSILTAKSRKKVSRYDRDRPH